MDTTELLTEAEHKLTTLTEHRAELESNLAAADAEIATLNQWITSLRELIGQFVPGGAIPMTAPDRTHSNSWATMTRSAAVQMVLAEASTPLGPSDIREALLRHGRGRDQDPQHYVSATLAYLKRIGSARTASRGKWLLVNSGYVAGQVSLIDDNT